MTGTYAVSAALAAPPDDYAGNTSTRGVVNIGRSTTGAIETGGDTDWFRVNLVAGTTYQFRNNRTSLADPFLSLRNSSGTTVLASNDDGGGNANSLITYRATYSGLHFLDARAYSSSMTGTYTVSVSVGTQPPPNPNGFSSISGYGLVDAAAAVARALGQNPFANVPTFGGPNDWGANLVNAPEAWARGYTGQGITVAVLDTGVDRNHADLSNNIWSNTREIAGDGIDNDGNGYVDDVYGWNFTNNTNDTIDRNRHGTHVAGTIAGVNNNTGVTGIAYNSRIMPVQVLSAAGSGSFSGIAQGIRYAVNNGAQIINMSLGGSSGDSELQSAVQFASSRGVIVVMAAGNDGGSSPIFPAAYATSWGIAVGAVDSNSQMASFSNRAGSNSSMAYVTAPGVSIYSTLPGNSYGFLSGTSMATPHVAGVIALMLGANRNLTDAQIRQILTTTSSNVLPRTSLAAANSIVPSTMEASINSSSGISSVSELGNKFAQQEIVLKNEMPTKLDTMVPTTGSSSNYQLASLAIKEQTGVNQMSSYDELTGLQSNYLLSSNDNIDLAALKLLVYS